MTTAETKPATRRPRKMAREPDAAAPKPKRSSKTSLLLEMLGRPEGATIDQLASATGWLPHTTRAALTGLKQKGHVIASDKLDGTDRIYRVVAA